MGLNINQQQNIFERVCMVHCIWAVHAKTCLREYADSASLDLPAQQHSLIRAFAVHLRNNRTL